MADRIAYKSPDQTIVLPNRSYKFISMAYDGKRDRAVVCFRKNGTNGTGSDFFDTGIRVPTDTCILVSKLVNGDKE